MNRDNEILKRFENSWEKTESLFLKLYENSEGFQFVKPIINLIESLKSEGKQKVFRLGTSMHSLIISRSVDFGLRPDQKCIKIESIGNGEFEVVLKDGNTILRQYRIDKLNDTKFKKLLITLENTLID